MPSPAPTAWRFKPAARRPGHALTWFQSWIVTRQRRNVVFVAARRSGKTVGLRCKILMACLDDRPGDVGYMAPTLGQAKRLLWRPLMQDLRDPAAMGFVEGRPNHGELTVEFRSGTRLYLYSAEAAERVRGGGFKLFGTDETDDPLFTDEVFDEAIYPALSDNLGSLYQGGTPKGRGRLFREYRKGQPGTHYDPEYESIQVSAMEAGIIAPTEIERARRTRPRRAFEQEYLATFNAPIGLVYDEWNEERHVVSADEIARRQFDEVIVGVDWGVAARGTMLVLGIDRVWVPPSDDYEGCEMARVTAIEEHSEAGLAYNEHGWWRIAQQIQRQHQPTFWYCDPAGGSADATSARAEGYLSQLAGALQGVGRARVVPADNRVGPGIAAVQAFLHYDDVLLERPRLQVSRACPWLIKEMGAYKYGAVRGTEDDFVEVPVKRDDHCFVAGTMVEMERGAVAIEDIRAGDHVLTREGLYPVLAAGPTREAAIWRLEASDGTVLEGTADHLIWVDGKGWATLSSLRPGAHLHGLGSSPIVTLAVDTERTALVYDLTVDASGPPEFYANGVLVHNCVDPLRYCLHTHFYSRKRPSGRNDAHHEDRGG